MKREYALLNEPRGSAYRALLTFALMHGADRFLLVLRPGEEQLEESGMQLLSNLRSALRSSSSQRSWPGTRLIEDEAKVMTFDLETETLESLLKATDGLFDWKHPRLPEDLAILRRGEPWLVSVTHERECYLALTEQERTWLSEAIPALRFSSADDEG